MRAILKAKPTVPTVKALRLFLDTSFETEGAKRQWEKISTHWSKTGGLDVCDSPKLCDFTLITLADCHEGYARTIRNLSKLFRYSSNRDRLFVFDTYDCPAGLFPGIYASLRAYLHSGSRHKTGCYMKTLNEFVDYRDPELSKPELLFSFQGNYTSRVLKDLFSFDFRRSDILIERSAPSIMIEDMKRFANTIWRSKFVLCPRGIGISSFRLFETMQSGRVPIIISDDWVPCCYINWNKVSLRVREQDIAKLPEICHANENRWREMGREARRTWVEWFSEAGLAKLIRSSLADIVRTRRFPESVYLLQSPFRLIANSGRTAAARSVS